MIVENCSEWQHMHIQEDDKKIVKHDDNLP